MPLDSGVFANSALSSRGRGNPDVVIVVPPWADPSWPVLGPSLLLAGCLKRNIDCHIFYPNLNFAATVGKDLYQKIAWPDKPFFLLIGEALFASYAFDINKDKLFPLLIKEQDSLEIISSGIEPLKIEECLECDKLIPSFLDYTVEKIINEKPAIVGFSSNHNQIMASLAIAKRIKEISPDIITVMGGALMTHPMGKALLGIAPMIDYVFSGKADLEFPRFCADFLHNNSLPAHRIINCAPLDNLDLAEIPNYDDYFSQLSTLQHKGLLPDHWPEHIPLESSRGCWWAAKSPCGFCGLNTFELKYREKSKDRVIKEIIYLKNNYGMKRFFATDTVMPEEFNSVLNEVIKLDERYDFYYEIKSNINPSLMDVFIIAGVVVLQVGIESLSTSILNKMSKGVSALQNLTLLREAGSRQISLAWNFLLGVPGETQEDYEKILVILPLLEHFQPPIGFGAIRLDRYSPYFNNPKKFGINNLRPIDAYSLIYPPGVNLGELACHFSGDYETILSISPEIYTEIKNQVDGWSYLWQNSKNRPKLSRVQVLNGLPMIRDTRTVAQQTFTALDNESFELLGILNEPTRDEALPDALRPYLPELLERKFVVFYEDHYISLVTEPQIGIDLYKQRNFNNSKNKANALGSPDLISCPVDLK